MASFATGVMRVSDFETHHGRTICFLNARLTSPHEISRIVNSLSALKACITPAASMEGSPLFDLPDGVLGRITSRLIPPAMSTQASATSAARDVASVACCSKAGSRLASDMLWPAFNAALADMCARRQQLVDDLLLGVSQDEAVLQEVMQIVQAAGGVPEIAGALAAGAAMKLADSLDSAQSFQGAAQHLEASLRHALQAQPAARKAQLLYQHAQDAQEVVQEGQETALYCREMVQVLHEALGVEQAQEQQGQQAQPPPPVAPPPPPGPPPPQ